MAAPARLFLLPRGVRLGVVVAICLSLGVHWVLLQGIAWTGMLINFAREGAVIEAVEKTFDGQHGCALCAKVRQGREAAPAQSQQNSPAQDQGKMAKMDAVLVDLPHLVAPAGMPMIFALCRDRLIQRNELPETPPPRRAQA